MHAVNVLRTGVGVESVQHLYEIQQTHRESVYASGSGAFITTRGTPTRANEILNGGSLYWIIKQQISVRQKIENIETLKDESGKKFCLITMHPDIILTVPAPHRHIQGWRYLPHEKAPKDFKIFNPDADVSPADIDPQLSKELREAASCKNFM